MTASKVLSTPNEGSVDTAEREDDIHIGEILAYLLAAKWTILSFVLVALFFAAVRAYMATPVYQTDALLQIEAKNQSLPGFDSAAEIYSGFNSGQSVIETIKSRRVIGEAVDKLHLTYDVAPRYFPYIGSAIAHRYHGKGVAEAFLGLDEYAWGGEVITLDNFDVTGELTDVYSEWQLIAGINRNYILMNGEQEILRGSVGTSVTADYKGSIVEIHVSELMARPGVSFIIRRSSRVLTIDALKDRMVVSQSGEAFNESGMITVSMEGSDPQFIVNVVNAVTQAYVSSSREKQAIESGQKLDFIDGQIPLLEAKQDEAALALQKFQRQEESINLSMEVENTVTQLQEMKNEITALQLKKEALQLNYTDEHPTMKALDMQILASIKKRHETEQLLKELPEKEWKYLKRSRDLNSSTELYMSMLKTAQELRISRAGMTGNIHIIDPAIIRPGRMRTSRSTTLFTGLIIGLLLGIVWVLLRRMMHRGVEDPMLLERETGLPVFATIPHSVKQKKIAAQIKKPGKRRDSNGARLLAYEDNTDMAIEALRSFRINMRFALKTAENNVIIITGPAPSVGKSFFASNYAAVSCREGQRVLLIDADMRKGHLHQYMGRTKSPGLSELIAGDVTLHDAIHEVENHFYFLSCGKRPPNPSELLETEDFHVLLDEMNENFDLVIIDTPPILAVADASIIAHYGGKLFVLLRSGQHNINEIHSAISKFEKSGAKVTGLLINDQEIKSAGYGYSYQYNYK